jgi:activating signal cointegrator complex subunit 3
LLPAELGRVASHYYIRHSSIVVFNEHLKPHMGEADILAMIALSSGACFLLLAVAFLLEASF